MFGHNDLLLHGYRRQGCQVLRRHADQRRRLDAPQHDNGRGRSNGYLPIEVPSWPGKKHLTMPRI